MVFELIRCFCAVPMLPYHRIEEGVNELWLEIQELGWGQQFRPLYEYFQREWLPRAEELSVFMQPERTNNCSESDNHALANVFPKNHPNIWQMIGKKIDKFCHYLLRFFPRFALTGLVFCSWFCITGVVGLAR